MTIYSKNEALTCKIFPFNLKPMAMRWFYSLEKSFIHSYDELTRAFGARFVTCSRVPKPFDSLIVMSMKEGETLRAYSDQYWELYNEIRGNNRGVVASTFKVGLAIDSKLRTSLTLIPITDMHKLIERVEEYKILEDDQLQVNSKSKTLVVERKEARLDHPPRPRRDFYP
ncbi:uncharacterized protein LOC112035475 [Quercus suber]|uniref:uncharacterized protein LOC112035475 n=1 Tax=Quercus suber TaxID=58331 RepID=UPI000CE1D1CC|nr:uncharacterized protein LOC112035475 [Quercus suber]